MSTQEHATGNPLVNHLNWFARHCDMPDSVKNQIASELWKLWYGEVTYNHVSEATRLVVEDYEIFTDQLREPMEMPND